MEVTRHPIIKLLDENTSKDAYTTVHKFKINHAIHRAIFPKTENFETLENAETFESIQTLQNVIETFELAVVDYWPFAFDTKPENSAKKQMFHNMCRECFSLMQVCSVPENPIQKIIHILKLLAYAYLGEKWEDMTRYLKENKDVWDTKSSDDSSWNYKLFTNIYLAILYLTRKESWSDIAESAKIIADLRIQQKEFEKNYLEKIDINHKRDSAYQLASLYHLAKSVELVGEFMLKGSPSDIQARLDLHFQKAIRYSNNAKIMELDIILRILDSTFKKMIHNSVWIVAKRINSRVTQFIELMTKSSRPVFELLYPQRLTILEKGLLDPASRSIVVNLPTSSGKTMMAEFRILQALNTFGDQGKIVYVVPTRALVNQITSRLRRDLSIAPLNIKIEKMSGAVQIDSFEENLLSSKKPFDVLVTTPEKLQLLIRHPEKKLAKSLVLAIIDEAHNLGNGSRGFNLEMLLSTIKNDCERSHLLLLTPFIPNSHDIAKWLDPQNPKSIGMELDWQPNDRVVGLYYAQGNRKNITTFFKPLVTSEKTMELNDPIQIKNTTNFSLSASSVKKTNYKLTALVATQLNSSQNFLVLGRNPNETWKIADLVYKNLSSVSAIHDDVLLVIKFIKAELGEDFPLAKYLEKGIGIHHAGLPEEMKNLMEWLMERGRLRILVATTTIAQGVNFPVSGILMSSYAYPYGVMPHRDFWNLLGRAGRIDQQSIGVIGLAVNADDSDQTIKTAKYVQESTEELISVLVKMVNDAFELNNKLDLSYLAFQPEWSNFVQYIAHMKNQSKNLAEFIAESELTLKQTYGYDQLESEKQKALLDAVKDYAEKLDKKSYLCTLSDLTGFTPETIESTMNIVQRADIGQDDWNAENLFSPASEKLNTLVGIMLNNITEVKDDLNIKVSTKTLTGKVISNIISDWVTGKTIPEIALSYFGGSGKEAITNCVRDLYGKITHSATWGLAGLQKIPGSGLEFKNMTDTQKREISNLPAMIYYGVDNEEAILMRMYNVPRSMSKKLGAAYKNEMKNTDIYSENVTDVTTWLDNLSDDVWASSSPSKIPSSISGLEYKKIWQTLSGKNYA